MTLVAALRQQLYRPKLQAHASRYAAAVTPEARAAEQLALWNAEWARIAADVPHYRDAVRDGRLPARFASWAEFAERMPVTTRRDVQGMGAERSSASRPAEWRRMTGGSTSEPVQLPAWKSELAVAHGDVWLARGWYGITPASRLFLLWGHAHLLGTGVRGWINARRRQALDRLIGYHRFSAYDLTDAAMRRAAEALRRFRPDYVLGYSVALDRFARVNADRSDLRQLGVRLVVGAAEAFPAPDGADRVRALLGCPVAMEYGSVETMLLAHTHPEGGYRALWRSYVVEAEPVVPGASRARIRVTSLYPRCFPLVRYELGDEIELDAGARALQLPVHRFARVIGRSNDYIEMEDGAVIHSEALTHAVRECAAVLGYQLVAAADGLRVQYLADAPLDEPTQAAIHQRLGRVHPALGRVPLRRVDTLIQTRAGKTRMIVRDRPEAGEGT